MSLTASERRWSLVAAIACVTVFGLTVGQSAPLLSLLLESRGTDATLTGLNAASVFVGVIVGPLLTPRLVARFGIRNFLLICLAIDALGTLSMKVFDSLAAWFALRILLGMVGSSIFTASEAWINLLAGDATRGRVLGLYAASLSAGFGLGALLLTLTGVQGWPPFVVGALITAAAALPVLGVGNLSSGIGRERSASPLTMFARAPFLVLVVATFGLYETALMNLLPVWGVRVGMSRSLAAAALSAVYFGSILMQWPVGWLADRIGRYAVLQLCGAVGLTGPVLVLAGTPSVPVLFGLLFVWGGLASAIYPVALGIAGDRFRGGELVAVNAAMITAYGLGSLVGPTLGGVAMDVWDPHGLFVLFALIYAAFLLATFARAA